MKKKKIIWPVAGLLILTGVIVVAVVVVTRLPGNGMNEDEPTSVDEFFGTWQADGESGFIITAWRDENGVIYVNMDRESGTDRVEFWECVASYDTEQGALSYTGCLKTVTRYTDDDGETTDIYDDGRGTFEVRDGKLYWEDDAEDTARGLAFTRIGEY